MKIFLITLLLFPALVFARTIHPERWYQENWCAKTHGKTEVVLSDRTRCDCLTDEYAVEFDFDKKWAEAIGQALYYSLQTGKKPGIVLILEKEKDNRYWIRLNSVIDQYDLNIKTWQVSP